MLKIYTYDKCDTCRKALRFLAAHGISIAPEPIRQKPPTKAELKRVLRQYDGQVRKLFNTSGQDYKALNLKDKLPHMNEEAALELLSTNGNLVKRPFLITDKGGAAGFDEESWRKLIG